MKDGFQLSVNNITERNNNNVRSNSMTVRTKAYTINRLINEVSALNGRKVTDYATFVANLSPRGGQNSAKIKVLNSFLGGDLKNVIYGDTVTFTKGKTVKSRVISALKHRKQYGWF